MRRALSRVAFVLTLALLVGCTGVDSNFCRVRELVIQSVGARQVVTEFQLGLGPGPLWLGGTAARLVSGDAEAAALLLDIRSVQVGVYRLNGTLGGQPTLPNALVRRLARRGYEPIVKVARNNEATLVLAQMRKERLQAIFVVAVDGEELVLAEVRGRLEKVVEEAVRRRGVAAKHAFSPAMADQASR